MPITKTGEQKLPEYLSDKFRNLWRTTKDIGIEINKHRPSSLPGIGFLKLIGKGLTSTGKVLYNNPKVAIPASIAAIATSKLLPGMIRKNMYHVDPAYNITHQGPLGGIKYNDEKKIDEYKEPPFLMI